MAGGKGKKGKAATTSASSKRRASKSSKSATSLPLDSLLLSGSQSEPETGPVPDSNRGDMANIMELLRNIHSQLDAQQKELDDLRATKETDYVRSSAPDSDQALGPGAADTSEI